MTGAAIQTTIVAAVPTLAVLVGILVNNSRLPDVNMRIAELRAHMDARFDDMRDLWRAELHRV